MRRHKLVALIGVAAIAIAGCASEDTTVTSSPSPSPSVAASPQPSPTATQPTAAKPLVAQKLPTPGPVPGLIQPTNIKERERQIQAETKNQDKNPFAGLPPVVPRTPTNALRPVPQVSQLPNASAGAGSSAQPGGTRSNAQGDRGGSSLQPKREITSPAIPETADGALGAGIPPASSSIAALPPKPSTENAIAVEVTGVVTVGNKTQAIVFTPGEGGSRYVGIGQRIANGRVLVKRIEMNAGSEPVVILEENGVEIAKAVGEKAPTRQTASAPS